MFISTVRFFPNLTRTGHNKLGVKPFELRQEGILAIELIAPEIMENQLSKTVDLGNELTVTGKFSSAKIASLLLNAIALEHRQGCKKVKVKIVVEDAESQKTYQEWFDRCSDSKT